MVTILYDYGPQNSYFFNEVIGLGGGGFQRKPDKKKVSYRV